MRLDLRSLAVFRMGIAGLLLVDQLMALPSLEAFYSDQGVLPRRTMFDHVASSSLHWSLYFGSDSGLVTGTLIGLTVVAALALMFGYRTWLATVVCWVMVCSIQERNPLVLHGGDSVTRLMLFWGMFLPLGGRWSLDAALGQGQGGDGRRGAPSLPWMRKVPWPASLALLLQIAFIYWFGAELKAGRSWHADGTALYTTLSLDQFATRLGTWFAAQTEWCRVFTHSVWWLEAIGPCLLFVPIWNGVGRMIAIVAFVVLHLGIAMMMRVGPFSWLMCSAWLVALPAGFWEWIERHWPVADRIERFFAKPRLHATFAILGRVLPPRESAPDERTAKPGSLRQWRQVAVSGFCLVCIGYVTLWNLRFGNEKKWSQWFPHSWDGFGHSLRLGQGWKMFAEPSIENGWPILEATLADGMEVDLIRYGAVIYWERQQPGTAIYASVRWQKLLEKLPRKQFAYARSPVAAYLCREWNEHQPAERRVVGYRFWFMSQRTRPPGLPASPVNKVLLAKDETFTN